LRVKIVFDLVLVPQAFSICFLFGLLPTMRKSVCFVMEEMYFPLWDVTRRFKALLPI
jgi:hypothetical protein